MTNIINDWINELGMTPTMMLVICALLIVILILGISFCRQAKKRKRTAGPLETGSPPVRTKTSEEKKKARVRKRKLRWNASDSFGVVGYKIYWAVGKGVDYGSDFAEVGSGTEVILPNDVPSFPMNKRDIEIAVVAVDFIGNESDMIKLYVPFGFNAPDPPTGLKVETL